MDLWLSASAYNSWLSCPRSWVLSRVWKLPGKKSPSLIFGTVLHAVVARWLEADETGRDKKTGQPVDPYPEGWETCDDGTIRSGEAEEIRALVDAGIGEGILYRSPGQQVEWNFKEPMESVPGVTLVGMIDVIDESRHLIVDHKTAKGTRYLLNEQKLTQDPQMLLYAGVAARRIARQGEVPEAITVRHNQFIREGCRVRTAQATIELTWLEEFWSRLEQDASEMLSQYRKARAILQDKCYNITEFEDGAPDACNAYGGCPFVGICAGNISVWTRLHGGNKVNLFEKMKAKMEGDPCIACGGSGNTATGDPCKACVRRQLDNAVAAPPPPEPTTEVAEEVATEVATEVTTEVEKPKKTRGRPKGSKNRSKKDQVEAQPILEPDIAPPPAVEKEGPTLYIRCVPAGRVVTCVERVFKAAMELIMSDLGADAPETFWHVDPFRRRDMLTVAADRVEIITDVFVAAPDSTPEMKAFVQGLRQRFENIVEGV